MAELPAVISGAGLTEFGRIAGSTPLALMARAADLALADAGLDRQDVDGLITGYATTHPHLMFADLFAEYYNLQPRHAHAMQSGGATGAMMILLAARLIATGELRNVLVVAGENRLSGQSRDAAVQTLAQVGHPAKEVSTGAIVPAYYALAASRYLYETGATERDLAQLAVTMREHAAHHPGAHLRKVISIDDVMGSRPISTPLKLLDCCPISDGACAFIISREAQGTRGIRVTGWGEGHTHQHISAAPNDLALGARLSSQRAFTQAGRSIADIDYIGIYDSFTTTLAMLLEATGFSAGGRAGWDAADGVFGRTGRYPLNLHGGLLSYGHCGVAGGMAIIVEAVSQLRCEAGDRQAGAPRMAYIHGDGGVMSAHVSLILEAV